MIRTVGISTSRSVKNHDEAPAARSTKEDKPFFADRMQGIRHRHRAVVVEGGSCFLKAHPMAAEVCSSLDRIPLEAECHGLNLRRAMCIRLTLIIQQGSYYTTHIMQHARAKDSIASHAFAGAVKRD